MQYPWLDTFIHWLQIDSTSGDEAEFLEALEKYFVAEGYTAQRQPVEEGRWNLLLTTSESPRVLFSTHVDTVPPFFGPKIEEGKVFARGACDTKGGIVAMAEAGRRLKDAGHLAHGYLFVVGEEVDHCGAKASVTLSVQTDQIILCEPTVNQVVKAQKGMVKLELRAAGVAGHSAFPDRGESAIEKLLVVLERIRSHEWPTNEILGPTTINVGVIEGGVAANVFAPSARAELLIRAVSPVEPLMETLRELSVGICEISFPASNDPVFFEIPDDVSHTIVPFNTDATYLSELGPVWLVGPGDIQTAHSDHEHIVLDELERGIELYERLALRVLNA